MQMKTIVLAEDESFLRLEIAEWLTAKGYDVVETADGAAALEWLVQNRALEEGRKDVFAVLSDNSMPKMTGEELQRELQSHKIFKNIPFIMATATPNPELKNVVTGRGGHFLIKPYTPKALEEILALICR